MSFWVKKNGGVQRLVCLFTGVNGNLPVPSIDGYDQATVMMYSHQDATHAHRLTGLQYGIQTGMTANFTLPFNDNWVNDTRDYGSYYIANDNIRIQSTQKLTDGSMEMEFSPVQQHPWEPNPGTLLSFQLQKFDGTLWAEGLPTVTYTPNDPLGIMTWTFSPTHTVSLAFVPNEFYIFRMNYLKNG